MSKTDDVDPNLALALQRVAGGKNSAAVCSSSCFVLGLGAMGLELLGNYGSVLVTIAVLLAVEAASRSGNADSSVNGFHFLKSEIP